MWLSLLSHNPAVQFAYAHGFRKCQVLLADMFATATCAQMSALLQHLSKADIRIPSGV